MSFHWRKKKDDNSKSPSLKATEEGEAKGIKTQPIKVYKTDNASRPGWVRQWKV